MKEMYLSKYTGGKVFARKQIFEILESNIEESYDEWLEPFVGAGSIFFKAIENDIAKKYLANDLNNDLISVYKNLDDSTIDKFINLGKEYGNFFGSKEDMYNFYKTVLREYNSSENKESFKFLFLLTYCYGGVITYNRKKELVSRVNYDFLKRNNQVFLQNREKSLKNIKTLINESNVEFFNYDYKEFLNKWIDNTKKQLIFLDPPYESQTMAYNGDKLNCYNAEQFLEEFKNYKNENNILLITIRVKNKCVVNDIFKEFDKVEVFDLNTNRVLNSRFNKISKIEDCLIIVE